MCSLVRTKATTDYKNNIPLKDRCGVVDLAVLRHPCTTMEEHAANLCYCEQREDRGVEDSFYIEFTITSHLYESDMSYTKSKFGNRKETIEKSVDEMFLTNLNSSVFRESGFVRR